MVKLTHGVSVQIYTKTAFWEYDLMIYIYIYIFFVGQQPPVGQSLLIIEASRSHSDTPQSVGLLWTSDQPYAKTST